MGDVVVKEIMPRVNLTCVRTMKFKTGCISITLVTELDKKTTAMGALLPQVLRRGTVRHPDMASLSAALDELYGARIEPIVRKKGEAQCIGFYSDFVDGAFLPSGENTLEKAAALLGELLLMPDTAGGRLKAEYVESEKSNLKDRIRAAVNDKIQYSLKRATEIMCASERYGVSVLGKEEDVDKITVGKLTGYYRSIISGARIEMFYCGSAEPSHVEAVLLDAFESLPRTGDGAEPVTEVELCVKHEPVYYKERLDVSQGKLAVGFRLGETMRSPNYAALKLLNAVYGGSVTSKLFLNVREKLSLCYFASSRIDRTKGVMFVVSGVEFEKYQAALDEILLQLDKCKTGEISAEELENAKRYVITSLKTTGDSQFALEDYYFSQSMDKVMCSPEEMAELVRHVTGEEVTAAAGGIALDTVYFLEGKEETANETAEV